MGNKIIDLETGIMYDEGHSITIYCETEEKQEEMKERLLNLNMSVWHDMKSNPEDLPCVMDEYLCFTEWTDRTIKPYGGEDVVCKSEYLICRYYPETGRFYAATDLQLMSDRDRNVTDRVIAWSEFELYKEKV